MAIALKVNAFGGMQPAIDARLLPAHSAATAENSYVITGRLQGQYQFTQLRTNSNSSILKVFRIPISFTDATHLSNSYWVEFTNQDTDIIKGPVVGDTFSRYYWASSSASPMYNTLANLQTGNTNPLLLGVPQPSVAPTVSVAGGSGITEARAYVYTYVTVYGEEGPPSSPTTVTGFTNGTWNIGLTCPAANDTNGTNRLVLTSNIYRTVTGSNGVSTFFFVATVPCGEVENGNEHSNTTIDGLTDTTRIAAGFSVTGSHIPGSTTVSGAPLTSSLTISNAATQTATGVSLTFSPNYADTISDTTVSLNNQLISTNWSGPPSDLQGWVSMPNGMIAGWRQNEVWFCEPYRPHAWPAIYAVAVAFPIVGLGVAGQTLIICTESTPYWGYGINPSSFAMSMIQSVEPCMSRGSIMSAPEGVYYASPNGIILANQGAVMNVTKQYLTKDQWLSLTNVPTLRAARLGTTYYAWGSGSTGVFEPTAFAEGQTGGIPQSFDTADLAGTLGGVQIDFADPRIAVTELTTVAPNNIYNTFNDPWTGEVFLIQNGDLMWLNIGNPDPAYQSYVWQSRIFETPNKKNLGALKVFFDTNDNLPTLPATPNNTLVQTFNPSTQWGLVRVYADGRLVFTRELRVSGELMRLPSGFKSDFWQIEINAQLAVVNIQAAESAKDLTKAGAG